MLIIYFLLLLMIHLLILMTFRFTAWPEMFSYPYLLDNGFNLYKDIALPYMPLLPELLRVVYKVGGFNLVSLQVFTWSIILFLDVLIFLISLKILGKKIISLLPVLIYIFLQTLTEGNMLWFDLACVPFILLGLVSYLYIGSSKKYFWLGVFLSLAFFIKQQIGISIALTLIYFLINGKIRKNSIIFLLGLLVPGIAVLLYILFNGLFQDFLFWTVVVPLNWYPKFPGYVHMPSTNQLIWLIILFSPAIFIVKDLLKRFDNLYALVIVIFLGTFLAAFPRFELFRLQPLIAVYVVLFILLLRSANKLQTFFMLALITLAAFILIKPMIYSFNQEARFYEKSDINISGIIKNESKNTDTIYLLGISSLQYVLAEKIPPMPWVDNYTWYLEIPGIQESVITGLQKNSPGVIFWRTPEQGNWYDLGVYQPKQIVEYIKLNYDKKEALPGGIEIWTPKD